MSTVTTNFSLFKPELQDPADITEFNANWDKIDTELVNTASRIIVTASSTDGVSYTATVPYVSGLYNGLEITIIPDMTSTVTNPTLNINNLGAKQIQLPLTSSSGATTVPTSPNFYGKDRAVKLIYTRGVWQTVNKPRVSASTLYGSVPVTSGGTSADNATDARKNLGAVAVTTKTITLSASGWSNLSKTVDVSGVTADNLVVVTHSPNSYSNYVDHRVRLHAQADGKLTFKCDYTPSMAITVNVAIFD